MSDEPKKFGELPASDKKFVRSRQLMATKPPRSWVGSFSVLAGYDAKADKKRQIVGAAAFLSVLSFVAGVFIGSEVSREAGFVSFGISALLTTGFAVWWWVLRGVDIPNQFREFIFPLVSLLSEDCAPGQRIRLQIDLRGFEKGPGIKTKEARNGRNVKVVTWTDLWFRGTMKLHDGSSLEWSIEDEVRRFSYWKRSRSGKMKHKVKFKTRRDVLVALKLRTDTYAAGAVVGKKKDGAKRSTLSMRRKLKTLGKPDILPVDTVLTLIGDVYAAASPQTEGAS